MQAASKGLIALAALAIFSWTLRAEEATPGGANNAAVKIGQKVGDFTFKDIRYLPRQLADFGEKKAFVIAFTTLDCPVVQRYLPRLKEFDEAYRDQGVQFLAVNVGPSDAARSGLSGDPSRRRFSLCQGFRRSGGSRPSAHAERPKSWCSTARSNCDIGGASTASSGSAAKSPTRVAKI